MATERERKVQDKAIKIGRQYRCYVYKNAQNIYTEKGRPDLTYCVPVKIKRLVEIYGEDAEIGIFMGIELKREGHLNNVSEAQQIVGNKIKEAKGLWFAIDNADLVEGLLIKLQR